MKNLITILFIFISSISFGQEFQSRKEKDKDKPSLFAHEHSHTKVLPSFFNQMSVIKKGDIVTLPITQNTIFKGVVSRISEMDDLTIIAIKSQEISNLTLIFADRILQSGEHVYRGVIMSNNHKDMLSLEKDETSSDYIWHKKQLSDILPD
jgi:hypothetical protein